MSNPSEARCPRCAAPLPPSAPEGLCPRCLGALNLATDTVLTGADAVAAQPPLTPAELAPHFPQLEIIECLGRGGMGVVYRVRQKALNRLAALKLLAPERVTDAGFAERFTREAQALARLNHPNIVTIYDFGVARAGDLQSPPAASSTPTDGDYKSPAPPQTPDAIPHPPFYFLLMEFMDGVNLRQAMRTERFTPEQALAIVPPVCEALQYAHEQGIVHRDIKPENLLLDKTGRLKIADFGIAKILEPGRAELPLGQLEEAARQRGPTTPESFTAGTPGYMAPEQKSAPQRVDSRADIYSLGVVIYEMLTGELPAAKLQPPSRKVQIDVRLDEIVLRALEQRPELRFQTAADLRTQVETLGREDREERIEKSKQPPSLSSTLSPLSSSSARFLKAGTSTLTTPEQLATAEGQIFCYRTRGQLILDERQLMHSCAGTNTVIPLAAIRDLSIGQYPRTMNPAGIDLLSVTYEEGGQRKQVLLSPMEGFFGLPSTWNARVAEWFLAIREATTAGTGRAPGNTPAERLGVPGSSPLLLAVACVPLLVGAGLLWVLMRVPDSSSSFGRGASLLIFAALAIGFLAPALFGWLSSSRRASSLSGSSFGKFSILLMVLVPVLLLGFLLMPSLVRPAPWSGVTSFESVPVGVSNNVVIVDVTTEVGRGNAELRAMLDGPSLPAATEAALADAFFPPFAGTFIKPTPHAGNHPWRILSSGRQTWRLGFVLPDAALARDALENLRPVGPLPAVPDRTYAGTLFEVRQTNGQMFRASLQVALPFTSADTNWVSVSTTATHNESIVTMNWEVLASQPGTVRCQRDGNRSTAQLRLDAKSKLYRVPVRLELTKVGTNRVLLVTEAGGSKSREEFTGSFRELSAELVRFINLSAKTVRGAEIELCQFQGKSFTVRVDGAVPPAPHVGRTGASRGGFPGTPNFTVWAGAVGLGVVIGGIVLLVVLVRKGGNGGKIALLLIGAAGLFVAVALIALLVWRKASSDFGPGIGLVRLAKPGQMTLESNYPAPAQPYPPGRVQQTQNGFRLQLPAAQLASFEFFLRQADDSWQPVPSLTALIATGTNGIYHDTLYWTLRRGNNTDGNLSTNQLWFWTVSANANGGRPLPQLADHGTNFTHHVPHGESLDWWQLAVPASVTLKPGEQQIIPLFRTHGTATVRGEHPKEAFLRVRCEPLPTGLSVSLGQQLVEAGLAARALLAKTLAPTTNGLTTRFSAVREFVLRVSGNRADFLDLDFGKVVAGTVGTADDLRSDTSPSPFLKRVRAEGVDFGWATNYEGILMPVCLDMGFFALPREWSIPVTMGVFANVTNTWNDLPAESLKDWDEVMPKVFHTGLYIPTNFVGAPWIFQTRNGTRGLMQITAFTDNPRSLKIRYKLVQLVAAPSPTASTPPNRPAAVPLIRREVKQANPGGKDLVMTFEELSRDVKTSTAKVKRVSGASVPSAMFIARGAYDIARARGAAYFINLKEWDAEDGTRMYLIGFAPDKNVDPKTYFDLKEPLPADKRLLFLSVQAYERIFKDQP